MFTPPLQELQKLLWTYGGPGRAKQELCSHGDMQGWNPTWNFFEVPRFSSLPRQDMKTLGKVTEAKYIVEVICMARARSYTS